MKFEQNGLTYQLNQEEQTANVCGSNSNSETIFHPQTIDYQKKKYKVVRISSSSFKLSFSVSYFIIILLHIVNIIRFIELFFNDYFRNNFQF